MLTNQKNHNYCIPSRPTPTISTASKCKNVFEIEQMSSESLNHFCSHWPTSLIWKSSWLLTCIKPRCCAQGSSGDLQDLIDINAASQPHNTAANITSKGKKEFRTEQMSSESADYLYSHWRLTYFRKTLCILTCRNHECWRQGSGEICIEIGVKTAVSQLYNAPAKITSKCTMFFRSVRLTRESVRNSSSQWRFKGIWIALCILTWIMTRRWMQEISHDPWW